MRANGGLVWRGSLWPVLFTAVTPRTAGFNTLPVAELSNTSLLFIMMLMFVGGVPRLHRRRHQDHQPGQLWWP